jgi:hypothetical protein
VIDLGMVATPMVYFGTNVLDARSGIMVTGSHNPPDYNGFKMVLAGEAIYGDAILGLYQHRARRRRAGGAKGRYSPTTSASSTSSASSATSRSPARSRSRSTAGNGVAGAFAGDLYPRHGLRSHRTVLRSRRQLPEPPPGSGAPGKPAGPDRACAAATPNSAWPSTATATASASSPRTARSSSRTAR